MELQILLCKGPTVKGVIEEGGVCRATLSPVNEPKLKTALLLIYMNQACVYGRIPPLMLPLAGLYDPLLLSGPDGGMRRNFEKDWWQHLAIQITGKPRPVSSFSCNDMLALGTQTRSEQDSPNDWALLLRTAKSGKIKNGCHIKYIILCLRAVWLVWVHVRSRIWQTQIFGKKWFRRSWPSDSRGGI